MKHRELPFASALSSATADAATGATSTLTMSEGAELDLGRCVLTAGPTTQGDGTDAGSTSGEIDLEVTSILIRGSIELLGVAASPAGMIPFSGLRGVARIWSAGRWALKAGETVKLTVTNNSGQAVKFAFGAPSSPNARRANDGPDFAGLDSLWASSPASALALDGSTTTNTITFNSDGFADFSRLCVNVNHDATTTAANQISADATRSAYVVSIKDINSNEYLLGSNSPHLPASFFDPKRDYLWSKIGSQRVSNQNTFAIGVMQVNTDVAGRVSVGVPFIPHGGVPGKGCPPPPC
jgi:hypothetical protein